MLSIVFALLLKKNPIDVFLGSLCEKLSISDDSLLPSQKRYMLYYSQLLAAVQEGAQPESFPIDFLKHDNLPCMKLQRLLLRFDTDSHVVLGGPIQVGAVSKEFCLEVWSRSGAGSRGATPVRILPQYEQMPSYGLQTISLSLEQQPFELAGDVLIRVLSRNAQQDKWMVQCRFMFHTLFVRESDAAKLSL